MEETTLTERGLSMRNTPEDAARLERKFKSCQKVLTALGDPTRQHLICIMLQQKCSGERVIELARKTNLSRPAISQHMRILKEAGIVKSRKEKTCIYYYLDPEVGGTGQSAFPFWRHPGVHEERSGQERGGLNCAPTFIHSQTNGERKNLYGTSQFASGYEGAALGPVLP